MIFRLMWEGAVKWALRLLRREDETAVLYFILLPVYVDMCESMWVDENECV